MQVVSEDNAPQGAAARAAELIGRASRVSVLTGAGISTDSGIPDFRGPNGIWTKDPAAERASTFDAWISDPDLRRRAWRRRADDTRPRPEPNAGHRALVDLERAGKLVRLVTQNIDGLHQAAGHDPALVTEIHGTARRYACLDCGEGGPMAEVLDRVRGGDEDPHCLVCGGLLKSATISFGQSLRRDDIEAAERAAIGCDVLLAVGSTLSVYPAAGMVPIAARAGAAIVIVNGEPTDLDRLADVVVGGSISDVLPRIVAGVRPAGGNT